MQDLICTRIDRICGCSLNKVFHIAQAEIEALGTNGRENVCSFTNEGYPVLAEAVRILAGQGPCLPLRSDDNFAEEGLEAAFNRAG